MGVLCDAMMKGARVRIALVAWLVCMPLLWDWSFGIYNRLYCLMKKSVSKSTFCRTAKIIYGNPHYPTTILIDSLGFCNGMGREP